MKYLNYVDINENYQLNDYENDLEKALNDAIASLEVDGFTITKEQRQELKKYFSEDARIKLLHKRRYGTNARE